MKNRERGFVLPAVLGIMIVILILMPALVRWIQQDTLMMVKDQKRTTAFNLAEAAVDRGLWKLKSTTTTWTTAANGTVLAGYNFDITYTDIDVGGGSYRIKFSSGPASKQVTIIGEGRDSARKEVRALKVVVQNQTIYAPLMSGGNITWNRGLGLFWGPVISQGNITLADDFVAAWYYPRKFATGTVLGTAANPRDTNGLSSPNTDNVEWWSGYSGVPDIPLLDFAALRSSASATGTLNVVGCRSTQGGAGTAGSLTSWDIRSSCPSSGSHTGHFGNPWNHGRSARFAPNTNYVWYYEDTVVPTLTLSGRYSGSTAINESCGLRGSLIVRGNLVIDTPGEYTYSNRIPSTAYLDHRKLLTSTFDTAATNEYPGDNGFQVSRSTFNFGTETWCQPGQGCGWRTTVGVRGFTYVGGNLTILQFMDFNGAIWVNGTVTASGGSASAFCGIFYDDTLELPALNVVLIRQSWNETAPSSTVWN